MFKIELKQYKVGDELITTGEKICFIVGQTDRAGVFLIEGDKIRWEFYADHVVPPAPSRARSKFETLWYELLRSTRKDLPRPLILHIANAFFSGLHTDTDSAVDDCFKVVEEIVHFNAKANQCFRYILGAVSALIVVGLVEGVLAYFVGFTTHATPIFLAAAAGGVGAVVSVLQRIGSLEISQFAPLWYAFLQGMARVVLGVLFGVFFALANRANLVLGTFSENLYALAVFGALSGISERFVPEIIRKLESAEANSAASGHSGAPGHQPNKCDLHTE